MKGKIAPLVYRVAGLFLFYICLIHTAVDSGMFTVEFEKGADRIVPHLMSSIIFTVAVMIFFQSKRFAAFLSLMVFHTLLPIFGPVFTASVLTSVFFTNKSKLLGDLHEVEGEIDQKMTTESHLSYNEFVQQNMKVEPLVEILRSHADADIKRGAIETLTNICNPESIILLKECLSDQNVEVRFYASSALTKIEEKLNTSIIELKKKRDTGDLSMQTLFDLGNAYYEFVYLRLQDEASLGYYVNQAIKCFEEVVENKSSTKQHLNSLQKAYARAGRHEEARALKKKGDHSEENKADNLMYLAETYFNEGELAKCKKIIESEDFQKLNWEVVRDVKQLWLGKGSEAS